MKTAKLSEVSEIITRGISPIYTVDASSGVTVLNQKCIRNNKLSLDLGRLHDITKKHVPQVKYLQPGDILVNSTGHGTLGRSALVTNLNRSALTDSHVTIIRPKSGLFEPRYLAYVITMCEGDFIEMATGTSGQTELPRARLSDYEIRYDESISEQQRIVAKLDAAFDKIDRAIELNNLNLKNASELFNSQLDQYIASVSLLRRPLCELTTSITDGDHMPPPKAANGIPFVTISNINKLSHEVDFTDTFKVPRAYFDNIKSTRRPKRGDVLFTVTGSYGIPVLVLNDKEFCFQRHIALIRPKPHLSSEWLYYWILSYDCRDQADRAATGVAQKTVSLSALRSFKVPDVSLEDQGAAVKSLRRLYEHTQMLTSAYEKKSRYLSSLKQSALAEAFSESSVK